MCRLPLYVMQCRNISIILKSRKKLKKSSICESHGLTSLSKMSQSWGFNVLDKYILCSHMACSTFGKSLFYFYSLYNWNGFWSGYGISPCLMENFSLLKSEITSTGLLNNFLDGFFLFYRLRKILVRSFYISANGLCPHITRWSCSFRRWEQVSGREKAEGLFLLDFVVLWEGGFPREFGYILLAWLCLILTSSCKGCWRNKWLPHTKLGFL